MTRDFFVARLAAVCTVVCTMGTQADDAQKNIALSHVSSKSFFAVYLQPKQILAHKRAMPEIVEKGFLEMLKNEIGIDVTKLNQVVIQGVKPDGREFDDDDMVIVFHADKPAVGKAIRDKLRATDEVDFKGKKYFKPTIPVRGPSIYLANDRTFVVGMPAGLEQILADDGGMSPLIRRLKETDGSCDLAVAMMVEPIRTEVVAGIERDRSPGPHKAFGIDLFNNVDVLTVEVRLDKDVPISAALQTKEGSGEKVENVAKNLLKFTKTNYKNERDQMLAAADVFPLAKVAVDVFDKALAGVKINREDDLVRVSVEAKGGLPDAMDILLGLFIARGGNTIDESSGPGPAPPRIQRSAPADRAIP